jgi:hypothetical protein
LNEPEEPEEGEEPLPWERRQTFEVAGTEMIRVVVLKILENWGEEDYTCLYRFRAFEREDEEGDEDEEEKEQVKEEAEEVERDEVEEAKGDAGESNGARPVQDAKANRPAGRKRGRGGRKRK